MAIRTKEQARAWRAKLEAAAAGLEDRAASLLPDMFPPMRCDGGLIPAGRRIRWKGALKRAAVDLWDTGDNTPDNAPALWEDIAYREGIRVIPESITAGAAFALDELGWWGDKLYRSAYSGQNVWTPEQYPAGWEEQSQ